MIKPVDLTLKDKSLTLEEPPPELTKASFLRIPLGFVLLLLFIGMGGALGAGLYKILESSHMISLGVGAGFLGFFFTVPSLMERLIPSPRAVTGKLQLSTDRLEFFPDKERTLSTVLPNGSLDKNKSSFYKIRFHSKGRDHVWPRGYLTHNIQVTVDGKNEYLEATHVYLDIVDNSMIAKYKKQSGRNILAWGRLEFPQ